MMSSSNLEMPQWPDDWSNDQSGTSGLAPAQVDPGFSRAPVQADGIIGGLLNPGPPVVSTSPSLAMQIFTATAPDPEDPVFHTPWTVEHGGDSPTPYSSFSQGGDRPVDQAKGVQKAFDTGGDMVDWTHGAILQAGKIGKWTGALTGDMSALKGLEKVTPALTGPLAIGGGVAGAISDINNGVPASTAILGNTVRTGLVAGAGLAGGAFLGPLGGPAAAWAADRYLPDSASIGRGVEGVLKTAPDPTYFPM